MRLKSAQMLRGYMDFRRLNVRELAKVAGVSRSTIGHLHSGARNTCSPHTAVAIEEALDAPRGMLFDAKASNVSRGVAA